MMQLWSPVLFAICLGLQFIALYEVSGYFSFRESYFARFDRSLSVFTEAPDLQRVVDALSTDFEVRLRPDVVWVRRRHGVVKRLMAHACVVVVEDGYEIRSGAGPRALLGAGAVVLPFFALGPLVSGEFVLWMILTVIGALVFLASRTFLLGIARRFGEEVSVHI